MTTLRDGDLERVVELLRESAGAELLTRFRRLARHEVREKTPGDLVTVADEACEQRLAAGLARILPGVPVVGEEAVAAEPGLLAHIIESEAAWIVDPLDGTANFARGNRRFAIIVALVRRGETIAGFIHQPLPERTAIAVHGGGAALDGVRAARLAMPDLQHTTGFVGAKVKRLVERRLSGETRARLGKLGTLGCAGIEYIELLAGRAHFAFYRWTRPWDHAAGALMASEAGGVARRHDGRPYSPTQPIDAGILIAPDVQRWQELRTIFADSASAPLLAEI